MIRAVTSRKVSHVGIRNIDSGNQFCHVSAYGIEI